MESQRSLTAAVGLLACLIGSLSGAGCTPMVLYLPFGSDGKVITRYFYEEGLSTPGREIVPAPRKEELRKQILAIVQPGMAGQDVLRRLNEAGIKGDYAVRSTRHVGEASSHGCYGSQTWKRPDGKVWFVNMQFYFDDSGKLFRIDLAEDRDLRPDGTPRKKDEILPTVTIGAEDPDLNRAGEQSESTGNTVGERQSGLPTSAE